MLRMCQPLNLLPCATLLGCKSLRYGVQLYLQSYLFVLVFIL